MVIVATRMRRVALLGWAMGIASTTMGCAGDSSRAEPPEPSTPRDSPAATGTAVDLRPEDLAVVTERGGQIGAQLKSEYATRIGIIGWRYDRHQIVVRLVDPTDAEVAEIESLTLPSGYRVVVLPALASHQELLELKARLQAAVESGLDDVGWSTGINLESETVSLIIPLDEEDNDSGVRAVVESAVAAAQDFSEEIGLDARRTRARGPFNPLALSAQVPGLLSVEEGEFELVEADLTG